MNQPFRLFKVGTKVIDNNWGEGVVERIEEPCSYPVLVRFETIPTLQSYTPDGRFLISSDVRLTVDLTKPDTVKALIEGKQIEFRYRGSNEWYELSPGFEYRIKPEPDTDTDTDTFHNVYNKSFSEKHQTLELANKWARDSRKGVLKITWDGTTGLPKFFEVIDLRDVE